MKHLKHLISGLLMAALLVSCLAGIPALRLETHAASESDLTFTLNRAGDGYIVSDCLETASGVLVIPSTHNGLPVKEIYRYAFYGCSSLTSITIPDSVTSIGDSAFLDCTGLTGITIPDSVTSIGYSAFRGCSSLTSITIPDSVTSIGSSAFEACSSLTSITIPDSIASICDYTFYNCTSLTSITIPESVTSIGDDVFFRCVGLTSIHVEEGNSLYHSAGNCLIETDSKTLIAGCKTSQIPADGSVTSIGDRAFKGCSSLTSIAIPDSVTSIGDSAFAGCSSLINITIPDSVTSIGDSAFLDCTGLTGITIPDSVTSIGASVFHGCTGLTSIYVDEGNTVYCSAGNCLIETDSKTLIAGCKTSQIPAGGSVTSIGGSAFSSCTGLTSISIPEGVTSIGSWAFANCTNLASITIPDSISSIGDRAFSGCSRLTSITIPVSATSIGSYTFYGCTRLDDVYFGGSAPEIGEDVFSNVTATAYYYPDETWTEDVMQNYGGTITWVAREKPGQDVTISFEGLDVSGDPVTIQIFSQDKAEPIYEFSSADAAADADSWTVDGMAEGSYTVIVSKKNYVAREYPLTVGDEAAALDVELWLIGDVTGDGRVNYMDYGQVLSQAKGNGVLQGYALLCGDVTGDGRINYLDYGKILSQAKGNNTLW